MGSWPKQPDQTPTTSPQGGASSRSAPPQQGSCSSQGIFACGGITGGQSQQGTSSSSTLPLQVAGNRKRACDAGGRPLAPNVWDSRQGELRSPEQGSFSGGGGGGGSSTSGRFDDPRIGLGGGAPLPQGGLGVGLGRPPGFSGEPAAHEFVANLPGCGEGAMSSMPHGLGGVHDQLRSQLHGAQRLGERGAADEQVDSHPSRRAVSGGPGVGGQWGAAATTLGNGEEVIELDDIFDVRPRRRLRHAACRTLPHPLPHPNCPWLLTTLPDASVAGA